MLVKNAEPFFYPGNETGCLLIHGFTGAPTEMQPLGKYLADCGYSVLGIRLAGHGTGRRPGGRCPLVTAFHLSPW